MTSRLSADKNDKLAPLATKTWDGGGAINNCSEAANWSGDTVPLAADWVVFDATSTKNAAIDVDFTVAAFNINSNYRGTISKGASNLTINGIFTLSRHLI